LKTILQHAAVKVENANTLPDLLDLFTGSAFTHRRWLFHGQRDAEWDLECTLRRLTDAAGYPSTDDVEEFVERSFKRSAHHYLRRLPEGDTEWRALIRHYEGPSRLLDVTRSPYVAAFFACCNADPSNSSAIWAFDAGQIFLTARSIWKDWRKEHEQPGRFPNPSLTDLIIEMENPGVVVPLEPALTNERLLAQQGSFLVQTNISLAFEACLLQTLDSYIARCRKANIAPEPIVWKVVVAPQDRPSLMKEIFRMNISEATLYPGLEGFTRSLNTRARYNTMLEMRGEPSQW
jgi:hypothetical protein